MNTLTIHHTSLAVIREIEALAKKHGATIALSASPPAHASSVVSSAPMVTGGSSGGSILSIQGTAPNRTLHVSAPCACSGTYVLPVDGLVRQAVGDEGSGLWNATQKRIETQPINNGEFVRLKVASTSEEADALVASVRFARDGNGRQAWMVVIEKVK